MPEGNPISRITLAQDAKNRIRSYLSGLIGKDANIDPNSEMAPEIQQKQIELIILEEIDLLLDKHTFIKVYEYDDGLYLQFDFFDGISYELESLLGQDSVLTECAKLAFEPDWTLHSLGTELRLPAGDMKEVHDSFDNLRNGCFKLALEKTEPFNKFFAPIVNLLPEKVPEQNKAGMPDNPIERKLISAFLQVYYNLAPKDLRPEEGIHKIPLLPEKLQNAVTDLTYRPILDVADVFYVGFTKACESLSVKHPNVIPKEDVRVLSGFTNQLVGSRYGKVAPRTFQPLLNTFRPKSIGLKV